jgi:hypothetical protein
MVVVLELEGGINSECWRSPFKIGYGVPRHYTPGVKHGNEKAPTALSSFVTRVARLAMYKSPNSES